MLKGTSGKSCLRDKKNIKLKSMISGIEISREKVRVRDNHTCQICGTIWIIGERKFDVHHRSNKSGMQKKYDNKDSFIHLITLCHKCHLQMTFRLRRGLSVPDCFIIKDMHTLIPIEK